LAGRTVRLRPFKGMGGAVGLPNAGCGFRGKVRDDVVVEHQHQQEVHLHCGQKPSGRAAPGTMFQKSRQDILLWHQANEDFNTPSLEAASGI
jgi:hypothetical protein